MQISHYQSNRNRIKKELAMIAKGRRKAMAEVRSHECEDVFWGKIYIDIGVFTACEINTGSTNLLD
jgi:hypothetical protein